MMDESKILLTDIDEVLWDLLPAWIAKLNSKYGLTLILSDCKVWDMVQNFPMLTNEEIFSVLSEPGFWNTLEPHLDALDYIPRLQAKSYQIKLVSATSAKTAAEKIPAILRMYPMFRKEDIILCEQKWLVRGRYLVDDNIKNLDNREVPFLMTAPHNKNMVLPSNIIRVNTWEEIYNYLV